MALSLSRTFPVSCHPLEHILHYLNYCDPIEASAATTRDGRKLHGAVDFGDGHKAKRVGNGGSMSRAAKERQLMKSLPPMPSIGDDGSVVLTGKLAGNASMLELERMLSLDLAESGSSAGSSAAAPSTAATAGQACAMCGATFIDMSLFGAHVATCFGPAPGAGPAPSLVGDDSDDGLADMILGGPAPVAALDEMSALERELAMMSAGASGDGDDDVSDVRDAFYGTEEDDLANPMCVFAFSCSTRCSLAVHSLRITSLTDNLFFSLSPPAHRHPDRFADLPAHLLPTNLASMPRRVDGKLIIPDDGSGGAGRRGEDFDDGPGKQKSASSRFDKEAEEWAAFQEELSDYDEGDGFVRARYKLTEAGSLEAAEEDAREAVLSNMSNAEIDKEHNIYIDPRDDDLNSLVNGRLAAYNLSYDEDEVDVPLIVALLSHICEGKCGDGAVLVFLPGWAEISQISDFCAADIVMGDPSRVKVMQLHSQIQIKQQREVFNHMPKGVRKVVLSTNIAGAFRGLHILVSSPVSLSLSLSPSSLAAVH